MSWVPLAFRFTSARRYTEVPLPKFVEGLADRLVVPAGKRDVQVFDDDLPGFGLRKFAGGRASYFVKYNVGMQQRRLTLGKVVRGNLVPMRQEASKVLAKARLGTDTAAVKRAATSKPSETIGSLLPRYLEDRRPNWKPRYYAEVYRQLERDWNRLHAIAPETISRQLIVDTLDDVADEQGVVAADRARTALSGLFAWAIDRGYCEINPTASIRPRAGNRARDRVLTESELVEVWQASGDGGYGAIVRLLILTGQRRIEIGDLRWSEIDLGKRQIELPAERTKSGRAHIILLSDTAQDILTGIEKRPNRDLVFGHRVGGFTGWSKAKSELDQRISLERATLGVNAMMPPWRLHDLRRSFVTHVNEHGFAAPHVVEAIVNHQSGHLAGVAGVYNKALYLSERRLAMNLWSEHLRSLVTTTPGG